MLNKDKGEDNMSRVRKYVNVDYHYLVIESDGAFLMVYNNGEFSFPCVQMEPSSRCESRAINQFYKDGYLDISKKKKFDYKSKTYKERHCGIRRILYHTINTPKNKVAWNGLVLTPVPIMEVVTNKPAILSIEAKAIVRSLDHWADWKYEKITYGGFIYSYSRHWRDLHESGNIK